MSERGFNEIISSMQSEITDMESGMLNERSLRKRAEEDAETFQIKIRSLEVNLRDKMTIIAEKESDVKNLQKLVNFDQVKSTQINEMEEKVHELTHSLNVEATRMIKRNLERKDIKIQQLESALQLKNTTIQDLEDVAKNHNVNEMSDRIMNKTIEHLEAQLMERDSTLLARNEKITSVEQTVQEALGRIRVLETTNRDQESEMQNVLFKKQNAEREAVKLKTTCQSLEGKLSLFEKQNETIESRVKILIFEKHEATNKVEMLEKVVQDMAESTLDTASSVKEQHRLTEELRHANEQMATLAADLEKSNVTIAILRTSLENSDEQISRLSSESHANYVAKKAVDVLVSSYKEGKDKKQSENTIAPETQLQVVPVEQTFDRSESVTFSPQISPAASAAVLKKAPSSRRVIAPAQSFMEDIGLTNLSTQSKQSEGQGQGQGPGPTMSPASLPITPRSMPGTMSHLEAASGIMGKRHESKTTSDLAQVTDFINSITKDIEKITAKKKDMRAGIEVYTADFKTKYNRQPTAREKANAPDNIFTNYQQLSHILKKKNAKLAEAEENFKKLQNENASA